MACLFFLTNVLERLALACRLLTIHKLYGIPGSQQAPGFEDFYQHIIDLCHQQTSRMLIYQRTCGYNKTVKVLEQSLVGRHRSSVACWRYQVQFEFTEHSQKDKNGLVLFVKT